MNYFELFALPLQFSIDNQLLEQRFRELQRRFHPDNFANADVRERLLSVQKAAQINQAYQMLKDPISRAEHLLDEQTRDEREQGTSNFQLIDGQQTLQDSVFLMEQMTLREELDVINNMVDHPSKHTFAIEQLDDFDTKINSLYQKQIAELTDELNQALWQQAAERVNKLKFIAKLKQEIERVEERLLD